MLGNVYGRKWMAVEKATNGDFFCSLFLFSSHPFPEQQWHHFVVYRVELGPALEPEESAGAEGCQLKTRMEGLASGQNQTPTGLLPE